MFFVLLKGLTYDKGIAQKAKLLPKHSAHIGIVFHKTFGLWNVVWLPIFECEH